VLGPFVFVVLEPPLCPLPFPRCPFLKILVLVISPSCIKIGLQVEASLRIIQEKGCPLQKTILLVDDNDQARAIGRSKLQEGGFGVEEARNGADCIKLLQEVQPDLIILDLVMPIMDGYKVLQMLKTNVRTKDIPVIVMSGRGQPEEVDKALKLGASDFLVKMRTNPKILLEKVQKTLEKSNEHAAVPHYRLAVKERVFDAARFASDFNLPADYRCPKCGNPYLLELVPDFSHAEPWFSGHLTCSYCR
jgi:CheY-like chemotaxis protein